MGVYPPTPRFTKQDKRLLRLIANLLLEHLDTERAGSNFPKENIPLSDHEANELADLLGRLLESKDFLETCYFVEQLSTGDNENERATREIYLSGRKKAGRSRALASYQWSDFRTRIGVETSPIQGARVARMPYSYFLSMEQKLFQTLDIHPNIVSILMKLVSEQESGVARILSKKDSILPGSVKKVVQKLVGDTSSQSLYIRSTKLAGGRDLSAALALLSNVLVLFTTRDWTVTGTISTMAAAFSSMQNK